MNFSFIAAVIWNLSKRYSFVNETFYIHESSFRRSKTRLRQRLFYDGSFLVATSRLVCGEISRLIKLLRAVSRNAYPRETNEKATKKTHVALIYECFLCFHTPVALPVAPRCPFVSSSRTPSRSPTLRFLPRCFCFINA